MATLLEASGLTKRYGGIVALDSVDFEVREGITGLLGPNGAGKSTAIKLFLGLLRPTAGSAFVMGEEPYSNVEIRASLGYMPEHDCLPGNITATELLAHLAQISGLPPASARTRAADTLRHVGLDEERYRPIGEYSTGMVQRVKLAQALVHDPTVILLDEPTAGLDPVGREEMLALIRRTGSEFGISIVLSTHLMGDVESTCNRIVVLEGGSVVESGEVAGFTEESETVYIEVDGDVEALVAELTARGLNSSLDEHLVAVQEVGDREYDQIRDALVGVGARLRRLGPTRRRLSEIFRDADE